ncbi:bifunctional RNase H/acid phosphatase [Corynebacterium urealyticum]|uniref:bifunctional RNase H/acid phosphatase n=1 Tax=Corynebacterium urealyticum TaxID=43771 RepID=UPI0003486C80|nr:bifunctional RNase H/acid phosphatase [Corynebacterium urealyticum]
MGGNMRLSVECDGGSRGNPGPAGTGSSVKDAAGAEVGCVWQFIKHATNNVAEYQGLINGLNLAVEIAEQQGVKPGSLSVDVRMDSKLVVEQMSGRWKIKHPDMKPLAQEVKRIEGQLAQVSYTWVPRAQNARADELANRAMDEREGGQWIDEELVAAGSAAAASPAGDAEGADMLFELDQPAEDAAAGAKREEPAQTNTAATTTAKKNTAETQREDEEPQPAGVSPTAWMGKTAPTTLLLLRHGQTELNRDGKYSGRGNPELTDLGKKQIAHASRHISERGDVDVILSSPLGRCQETARAAAEALGMGKDAITTDEAIIEMDFGAWEGRRFVEIQEDHPEEHRECFNYATAAPHGGESPEQVYRRVSEFVDRVIAEYPGKTVLVVTHMMPIKSVLRRALGTGGEIYRSLHLDVASLSVADFLPNGAGVVRLVNESHYLG